MQLSSGSGKLHLALKVLRQHWDDTKTRWHDPVQQSFEEDHFLVLEDQVVKTLRAMDYLSQVMTKAYHDCGG